MKIGIVIIMFASFLYDWPIFAQYDGAENFRLSLGAKYLSRFTAYGIDLAEDKTAVSFSSTVSHKSGISLNGYMTHPSDNSQNLRQWTFGLGYETELIPNFMLSAEYNHYFYNSDTVNILSPFSNAVSVGADIDLDFFDIGFSYDQFLGSSGATYFGFDISTFMEAGPLFILPIAQISFISQTIEDKFITKLKGRKRDSEPTQTNETSISGLASTIVTLVIIYPFSDNIYASFTPSAILSHQQDLAADSFRFVWSAGIRYRLSF